MPTQPAPAAPPAPLELRLEVPARVAAGEPVPLRLVLANRGSEAVQVEVTGDPVAFDLLVLTTGGERVWRRLEGVAIEDILQVLELGPGEEIAFTHTWDQRGGEGGAVSPGTYRVRGILPAVETDGGWGAPPREITVLP